MADAGLLGAVHALGLQPLAHAAVKFSPQEVVPPATPGQAINFDEGWRFQIGDPSGAQTTDFNDATWRTLNVPHDWSIAGAFDQNAPGGGTAAYLPTGIGWYRKGFTLAKNTAGKRVTLEFDGIYQRSEVWINGVSLGMRPYGFIGFSHDLTPHLAPAGKLNYVAVRVDNSLQPNCRWYSGSGIYRHVKIFVGEPVFFSPRHPCVRTEEVSPQSTKVHVFSDIRNVGPHEAAVELTVELVDASGAVVAKDSVTRTVGKDVSMSIEQTIPVINPQLWSPASPTMYHARCTLKQGNAISDQQTSPFGIRTVVFDVDRGLLLNGEHIKMNGVCIHGDGGSVGTAVPERVWERRLGLLQEMGCNAIRLSHNPPAPELLDMLDRMGFLVMAEAFDEWRQPKGQTPDYGYHKYFDEWSERDIVAMLERDRNHPSIVIWSAGNEVPDQSDPHGPETLQRLMDIIHSKDRTRVITVACDEIVAEPKATLPAFLEKLDIVGYNYADRWRDRREKIYSVDRHDYPQRRFIGTESSALYGPRGDYGLDQSDELFFERTQNTLIEVEQMQKFIQTYDYVSGDFIWVGIDYLGEAKWPNKLAATGPLDTCGFKKDAFYFYKSIWSKERVLHLLPHWNWAGDEGNVIPVTCYTNLDTVELFLNGKSLGVKGYAFPRPGMIHTYGDYPPRAKALQTTADLHLRWDVPYAPGVLMAKGTKDGQVVETVQISTTGAPAKLALTVDRSTIKTNPSDVAHVTVEVRDSEDRIVPNADIPISFAIRGSGCILGVDNGKPDSHEPYKASERRAFNGLALVLLQAASAPGQITLTASSPSLKGAEIVVRTEA